MGYVCTLEKLQGKLPQEAFVQGSVAITAATASAINAAPRAL